MLNTVLVQYQRVHSLAVVAFFIGFLGLVYARARRRTRRVRRCESMATSKKWKLDGGGTCAQIELRSDLPQVSQQTGFELIPQRSPNVLELHV